VIFGILPNKNKKKKRQKMSKVLEADEKDRKVIISRADVFTLTKIWFSQYLKWDLQKMMAKQTGVEAQIQNLIQQEFLTQKKGEDLLLTFHQSYVLIFNHLKSILDARSIVKNRPIETYSEWVDNMISIRKEISDLEKTMLVQMKRYSNTKEAVLQQETTSKSQYEQDLTEKKKMCLESELDCTGACSPQKTSFFSSKTTCSPKKV
jgi:hypothetical protein